MVLTPLLPVDWLTSSSPLLGSRTTIMMWSMPFQCSCAVLPESTPMTMPSFSAPGLNTSLPCSSTPELSKAFLTISPEPTMPCANMSFWVNTSRPALRLISFIVAFCSSVTQPEQSM